MSNILENRSIPKEVLSILPIALNALEESIFNKRHSRQSCDKEQSAFNVLDDYLHSITQYSESETEETSTVNPQNLTEGSLRDYRYAITPAGDLEITMAPHAKANTQDMLDNATHMDHDFLDNLLEDAGWSTNGQLYAVAPDWIGALTDAPMISDYCLNPDFFHDSETPESDLECQKNANVWWYPDYQVLSFAEELIKHGSVAFSKAPKY